MGACLSMFGGGKTDPQTENKESLLEKESTTSSNRQSEGSINTDDMMSSQRQSEEAIPIFVKDEDDESISRQSGSLTQSQQLTNKVSLNDFEILKVIGEGAFGKVYLVSKKDSGQVYAMKMLKKSNITKSHQKLKTIEEKNIMMNMRSPFIVQLKFAFQTSSKLYFVMDFMQGGEMFYHIRHARYFKEDMARFYLAELTLALEYLHSKDTIYRDLKPENILLGADGHIKICDFGLSKQGVADNEKTKTICGTPEYLAPEILMGQAHGKEVDWYSLGCVMYEFLSGAPPFYNRDKQQMYQQRVSTDIVRKPQFTNDAWDLIESLLSRNPSNRITGAENVKKHPFFKSVDWEKYQKKDIKPPFLPKFTSDKDLRFISKEFQKQEITNTPMLSHIGGNANFEGFTFQENVAIND